MDPGVYLTTAESIAASFLDMLRDNKHSKRSAAPKKDMQKVHSELIEGEHVVTITAASERGSTASAEIRVHARHPEGGKAAQGRQPGC